MAWVQAVVWCVVSLIFGIQASIVGPTASILAEQTHSTEEALAPVLGMGGLCALLAGLPSGWLIDHVPGSPLLAATLALQALGFVLLPHCPSIAWLVVVYGAVGLTFNVINTGINVMAIWRFAPQPRYLAMVMNSISAAFGLGGVVAPLLVTLALSLGDGRLCYYATALSSLILAALVTLLPSPKAPHLQDTDASEDYSAAAPVVANGVLHDAARAGGHVGMETGMAKAAWDGSSSGDALWAPSQPPASDAEAQLPLIEAPPPLPMRHARLSSRQRATVLVPALLVVFANVSIELGFAGWIFMYSRKIIGMDVVPAEGMTSLYWAAFTGGRVAAAVLSSCVPSAWLLACSMPLCIVGSVWALAQPSLATTPACVVLIALGAACGFPATLSLTAEIMDLDGSTNGLISAVGGLAVMTMPSIVPWLAARDPSRGFVWLMYCTLIAAVMQLMFLAQLLVVKATLARRAAREEGSVEQLRAPLLDAVDET